MKLKILTLLLLFSICSFSSFAVIDSKERIQTEQIQNFPKENFSKKKNIKKRKFRLRDFFKLKIKIKKVRKAGKKKISILAIVSLILALSGIGFGILALKSGSSLMVYLFYWAELGGIILGVLGLLIIKRNPENLKGKWLALAGIFIPWLVGILLIALLIFLTITY